MVNSSLPNNKTFGLMFFIIFLVLGSINIYRGYDAIFNILLIAIGLLIGCISITVPALLSPFNSAWMKLSLLMGKIVSFIVLGFIFFLLITPIAIISRILGRDELKLKSIKVSTYWINRDQPGPQGNSFKNQF